MSLTRSVRHARHDDEEESHWVSFTDVMSGLLLVFILATVALMLQTTRTQASLDAKVDEAHTQQAAFDAQIGTIEKAEKVRDEILKEIKAQLSADGIAVTVDQDTSVLSIPTAALGFRSGEYTIHDRYAARATHVGSVLSSVLRKGDRLDYLDTVFVEGHTDSVPFRGPLGMDNWGLSAFRAISLWQLWGSELPKTQQLDTLKNPQGHPLFSVSGYADTRPVENAPKKVKDYAPNRRINIRITIIRPSSQDLTRIANEFSSPKEH